MSMLQKNPQQPVRAQVNSLGLARFAVRAKSSSRDLPIQAGAWALRPFPPTRFQSLGSSPSGNIYTALFNPIAQVRVSWPRIWDPPSWSSGRGVSPQCRHTLRCNMFICNVFQPPCLCVLYSGPGRAWFLLNKRNKAGTRVMWKPVCLFL